MPGGDKYARWVRRGARLADEEDLDYDVALAEVFLRAGYDAVEYPEWGEVVVLREDCVRDVELLGRGPF